MDVLCCWMTVAILRGTPEEVTHGFCLRIDRAILERRIERLEEDERTFTTDGVWRYHVEACHDPVAQPQHDFIVRSYTGMDEAYRQSKRMRRP